MAFSSFVIFIYCVLNRFSELIIERWKKAIHTNQPANPIPQLDPQSELINFIPLIENWTGVLLVHRVVQETFEC